jgi:hypothetical protein
LPVGCMPEKTRGVNVVINLNFQNRSGAYAPIS